MSATSTHSPSSGLGELVDAARAYHGQSRKHRDPQQAHGQLDQLLQASQDLHDQATAGAETEQLLQPPLPLHHAAAAANLLGAVALHHQTMITGSHVSDRQLDDAIDFTKTVDQAHPEADTHELKQLMADVKDWFIEHLGLRDGETLAVPDPHKLYDSLDKVILAVPAAGVKVVTGSAPLLVADLAVAFKAPAEVIEKAVSKLTGAEGHVLKLLKEAATHLLLAFGAGKSAQTLVDDLAKKLENDANQKLLPDLEERGFGYIIRTPAAKQALDDAIAKHPQELGSPVAQELADAVNRQASVYFIGTAALVKLTETLKALSVLVAVPGVGVAPEAVIAAIATLSMAAAVIGGWEENDEAHGIPATVTSKLSTS